MEEPVADPAAMTPQQRRQEIAGRLTPARYEATPAGSFRWVPAKAQKTPRVG